METLSFTNLYWEKQGTAERRLTIVETILGTIYVFL